MKKTYMPPSIICVDMGCLDVVMSSSAYKLRYGDEEEEWDDNYRQSKHRITIVSMGMDDDDDDDF